MILTTKFFVLLCIGSIVAKVEKYVNIGLNAKWSQTPLALEASEFIAEKGNDEFWAFVDKSANFKSISDKDAYNHIIDVASSMLSDTERDALKFSLSVRAHSPRVQLFQQLSTNLDNNCDVFFQAGDGVTSCQLDEIINIAIKSERSPTVHAFDHVYAISKDNKNTVILYADFTTAQFQNIHKQLVPKITEHNLQYVLRHSFQVGNSSKIALSGYGVELAVKSTEYKNVDDQKVEDTKKKEKLSEDASDDEVEGFLFKRLRELHPTLHDELDQFKTHMKNSNKELSPLKVWQLQDLSFQAAQRVKSASTQDVLKVLKDISQNVPMLARSLVKTAVNDDMRREIKENQKEFERAGISPGSGALFINGIEIGVDEIDAFKLLNILKSETNSMAKLNEAKVESAKIGNLLALNVKPEEKSFVVDTRSETVQWLNDLEKDQRYAYWPTDLQDMLRPTFPGMLRYVGKNIFHVVLYIDPATEEGRAKYQLINEMLENSTPVRFGIVFVVNGSPKDKAEDNVGAAIVRAFSFVKADKGLSDAFRFLTTLYHKSTAAPTSEDVINLFTKWYGASEIEELGADSEYDDLRRVSKLVFDRVGLKSVPQVLINGEKLAKEDLDTLDSAITEKILSQTPFIQQAIYMGLHYSYPSIYDYVMSQPNVVSRVNSIIQTIKGQYISSTDNTGDLKDISIFSKEQALGQLTNRAKYFIQEKGTTIWIVADADTEDGRRLILNAMLYVQKQKNARVAIILHGTDADMQALNWNDALHIILNLRQKLISGVAKFLVKFLEADFELVDLIKEDTLVKLSAGITGINKKKLVESLLSTENLKETKAAARENKFLVEKAFGVKKGESFVISNGRILGPLNGEDIFVTDDFELLQSFENNRCGYKISEVIDEMKLPNLPSEGHDRYKSDIAMKVAAILSNQVDRKRTVLRFNGEEHSMIHLPPSSTSISFDIEAVLDPLSVGAQKLAPILLVLYEAFNVNLRIFLNCKDKHSSMPVNRFYQYVLQPSLSFDESGNLKNDQSAVFTNLPHSALLTLIMDTPQSWMIEAVGSNQDLDNIHLGQASGVVYGDFQLRNIVIEGHCSESETNQPPRGLQFILGTEQDPELFDTIVMANLGYFQLKAFPGSFVLQLREGRSEQIYQIDSLEGGTELTAGQNYTVVVDDFSGRFLKVKVKRRPGQEKADLLTDDGKEEESDYGIWDSIASYVKREKSTKNTDGKIHIFSVATGLLYERFLRIMMLSVLNHTKKPVKFWFLKNYLSSGFTNFLPHYAEKYGFEYELVQYQWPRWLNGQTEKQRIIWGYKILFLDVLFPLNLERIIFVDADQIVRADLNELMEMDLDGAPYAYTPFCNDRPEVEGFRFWNQGYWRNHLAGRPYHISALYVVDLKRFRKVAAGDRLRGQYQGLSQDPNSLSNLDQDLPNNMIHQVQIKSLPQEWLWCETWCSDESKARAKTIDMCNNPETKEPKLQRAIRIAPEWTIYDDIIRKLQEDVTNNVAITKEETALPIKVEL